MGFLPTRHQIPFFLLFFLNFLFSTLSSPSTHELCLHEESVALRQFKNSFSIKISASSDSWFNPHPKTESWKEGTDCCLWDGVSCDNVTGHVVGLDLSCSCLFGSFPSNSTIFLLSQLQLLNLSHNNFNGSKIPSEIGSFSSLTYLSLSFSEFSGQVPKEISHLSHLVLLDLSANYFLERALELESITLRRIAQNFSQIRELILDSIDMSTVDPRYSMNLSSSIAYLSLYNCGLRGKFPKTVLFFPSLKMLGLGSNKNLTIELPKSNWSSPLQYLSLGTMNLSGEFPNSIKDLKSLENLYLYECNLKGLFPISIQNLTQIVKLDLSYNLLNGSVPSWLFSLPSLRSLYLYGNHVTGTLKELPQSSLSSLSLGNNSLQGSIPSSISHLVNLTELDLSLNKFSGVLDFKVFFKLKNLQVLSLSNLDLSLINSNVNLTLPNLKVLRLSTCNLSEFPNFLKESIGFSYLDLSNNKIQGSIPEWLWNIGNETLRYLNISHNSLVGNIDQLPWTLQYLALQSNSLQGVLPIPPSQIRFFSVFKNNFTGEIPSLICNASFLQILDLSHNQLSGKIPSCFHNLSKSLSVLDLQANSFHGIIPSTVGEGCQLKNVIFCENQFEGQLPQSLIYYKGLEVLDVSNNNIEDTFPDWLDTIPNLQVLDLKSNKFHGPLSNSHTNPSFPTLRILDLSNNDFCGTLPTQMFNNLKAIMKSKGESFLQYMEAGNGSYHYSVIMVMKGFTFEFERTLNIFMSIDLSNNKFEGEIPKMIGKLSLLKGLNFSHNNLSGRIPSSIRNLTDLEWLDLSSNQLVGNIPQELVEMTSLVVLNLSYNHLVGPIPQGMQFNTFENTSYEGNLGLCGLPLSKACSPCDKPKPLVMRDNSESIFEFGWKIVVMGYGCGFIFGLSIGCGVFRTRKLKWLVTLIEGDAHGKKRKGR